MGEQHDGNELVELDGELKLSDRQSVRGVLILVL